MSMGIGVNAYLIEENETALVYAYSGYDDNVPERKVRVYDGRIIIRRECFANAETSGMTSFLLNGNIKVQNCSNCWAVSKDALQVDMISLKMLAKLFREYRETSAIPSRICCYW